MLYGFNGGIHFRPVLADVPPLVANLLCIEPFRHLVALVNPIRPIIVIHALVLQ